RAFNGGASGRSSDRSRKVRQSNRPNRGVGQGSRVQVAISRLRDWSDAAVWQSLRRANLRGQASGGAGLHRVRSGHAHGCNQNELSRLRENREAARRRSGRQDSADEIAMKTVFAALALCLSWVTAPIAFAAETVSIIKIDGAIGPATASYISRSIEEARTRNAQCLVIQ